MSSNSTLVDSAREVGFLQMELEMAAEGATLLWWTTWCGPTACSLLHSSCNQKNNCFGLHPSAGYLRNNLPCDHVYIFHLSIEIMYFSEVGA